MLIIWDRLFGTFAAERKSEPVVYGLVAPIKTYNPITIQCKYFSDIFTYWTTSVPLKNKMQKAVKGPGWNMKSQEYYKVPDVKPNTQPWNVPNDSLMNLYVLIQVIHSKFIILLL